ncbi:MAG: hypothetical protein Q8N51_09685 [Gammaproteobacteria bacterium]|nr:hypothetical protein [Gammaproteobacteria bacterium]
MTNYEWDCELVACIESDQAEAGDILDHNYASTFTEVHAITKSPPSPGCRWAPVLVKNDDNGRSWAYLENDALPEAFEDALGKPDGKVPKRFHNEVRKVLGQ